MNKQEILWKDYQKTITSTMNAEYVDRMLKFAKYLLEYNERINNFYIKCYATKEQGGTVRFGISNSKFESAKESPFIVVRKNFQIMIFLSLKMVEKHKKILKDIDKSTNDFYRINAGDAKNFSDSYLYELFKDALESKCSSLQIVINGKTIHDSDGQKLQNVNYLPTEDDAEAAMLEHGGDDIDGNAILDIIEKNCNAKGLSLKDNWRELTLRNLELWANQG
jgi:hypothetical protein